jgi:hypothetical protein
MRILSIVPNSAATERLFSRFGIIHSRLRNRMAPELVRQIVLVKADTERKHGINMGAHTQAVINKNGLAPGSPGPTSSVFEPPTHCNAEFESHELLTHEVAEPDSFSALADKLTSDAMSDVEDVFGDAGLTEGSQCYEAEDIALANLFDFPSSVDMCHPLTRFWSRAPASLDLELEYHEVVASATNVPHIM